MNIKQRVKNIQRWLDELTDMTTYLHTHPNAPAEKWDEAFALRRKIEAKVVEIRQSVAGEKMEAEFYPYGPVVGFHWTKKLED